MKMIEEAREAYLRNWTVIPLKENDKRPNLPIGHEFLTRKPTVEEYKGFKFGNYGIVTGEISGICVLDIDGEAGREALRTRDLEPDNFYTPAVVTPKGVHYYFRYNPRVLTGAGIFGKDSHVDIRSDGSYVVGPGSTVDGLTYRWMEDMSPEDVEFSEPPEFMFEHKRRVKDEFEVWGGAISLAEPIGEGHRNTTLISVGGSLVRRDLPAPIIHGVLHFLNDNYMDSPLPDSEVDTIAQNTERYRE